MNLIFFLLELNSKLVLQSCKICVKYLVKEKDCAIINLNDSDGKRKKNKIAKNGKNISIIRRCYFRGTQIKYKQKKEGKK